jgi:hypothetical protein
MKEPAIDLQGPASNDEMVCAGAAVTGLLGLAVQAMTAEDRQSALRNLADVRSGRALLRWQIEFTGQVATISTVLVSGAEVRALSLLAVDLSSKPSHATRAH